jgi:tRNA modification GTPase
LDAQRGKRAQVGRCFGGSGSLEAEINAVKKLLLDVVCEVELNLDYSEVDGVGSEDAGLPAKESVLVALSRLDHLLALYQTVKLEKEGALVALVGRPNAGKSSLFNLLLKEERSIVTEIPGTTRDWIEGWIEIDGIPVRLADTAGIHEAADKIEQIGIERSAALAASADFVLTIIDGADADNGSINFRDNNLTKEPAARADNNLKAFFDSAKPPLQMPGSGLLVWNKCDLNPMPDNFCLDGKRCIAVSAKTGAGLPALVKAIAKELRHLAGSAEEGAAAASTGDAPGTDRQRSLIASAKTALQETLALSDNNAPLDIIAPRLRDALDALGEITGEVSNAGILEAMFGNFCVGK